MAAIQYYDVILKPVLTEKSMSGMGEKKYTFLVHPEAKSLFRFQYSSPQFTAIRIQHSIGLLFPPQPAVLYPWSDLFLEE